MFNLNEKEIPLDDFEILNLLEKLQKEGVLVELEDRWYLPEQLPKQ